jgi:hypothetical protein
MEEELEVAAILPTAPCEHDACAADDITARDREYIEACQLDDDSGSGPRPRFTLICNPVVVGWRCMAAGWLHVACNSAKLRSEFSDRSNL